MATFQRKKKNLIQNQFWKANLQGRLFTDNNAVHCTGDSFDIPFSSLSTVLYLYVKRGR